MVTELSPATKIDKRKISQVLFDCKSNLFTLTMKNGTQLKLTPEESRAYAKEAGLEFLDLGDDDE